MRDYDEMTQDQRIDYAGGLDKNKLYSKASRLITKEIGKTEASLAIVKKLYDQAGNAYDINLTFEKVLEEGLLKLWEDKLDVYNIVRRPSLRDENHTVLYEWISEIKIPEVV